MATSMRSAPVCPFVKPAPPSRALADVPERKYATDPYAYTAPTSPFDRFASTEVTYAFGTYFPVPAVSSFIADALQAITAITNANTILR
jgi:hypothetical protein